MKKLVTISAIMMSGLIYNTANAQIRIGIRLPHIVIVPRPVVVRAEAPVYQEPVVSDNCDFYYLPDVGAYYSVSEQCYYYQDGNNWISAEYLPGVYRDYDWRYATRRVEIREARPYLRNDIYRSRYRGFDRDIARNHDHFAAGFDFRHDRDAYNNDHRFDNRGGFGGYYDHRDRSNDHRFDNHNDNNHNYGNNNNGRANNGNNRDNDHGRHGNQNRGGDNSKNRDRSNHDNQQRLAQNSGPYGHVNNKRDRF